MTSEGDEETFADIEGNPVGVWDTEVILALLVGNPDGLNVMFAMALGDPDGVKVWIPDRSETVRLKGGMVGVELLVGVVDDTEGCDVTEPEGVPTAVLFEEIVGSPDEGDPPDKVLLAVVVGSPDALEVGTPVNELLLADVVGTPEEFDVTGNPVDEMFVEIVENAEGAVELRGEAVLTLSIGVGLTVLLM